MSMPEPVVIRSIQLVTPRDPNAWKRQVPAWAVSGGIHAALAALFLIFVGQVPAAKEALAPVQFETIIDDTPVDNTLLNPDLGQFDDRPSDIVGTDVAAQAIPGEAVPDQPLGSVSEAVDAGKMSIAAPVPGLPDLPGGKTGNEGVFLSDRSSGAARDAARKSGGGSAESEAAVARALSWLHRQQRPNGSWETDGTTKSDSAGTGLALLPFLAAGVTHKSNPNEKMAGNSIVVGSIFASRWIL